MKETIVLRVCENRPLSSSTHLLKLRPIVEGQLLPHLKAGQFVGVLAPHGSALLRRPISVCHYIEARNELWLLIARVGRGTKAITDVVEGETLDIVLPLGNSFDTSLTDKPLLVGGGVGIAPMLALAHAFNERGVKPDILLGGRSLEHIVLLEEFEPLGRVFTTTNDGSMGLAGLVTDHPVIRENDYGCIYTCGPRAMMRSVALLAQERDICCQVSLENTMACGIGACLCCVEDTHEEGNVCVCTEGPVFNSRSIRW